jgi:UDP-N-acetylglucosamine transferase subunit ALG13
MKIFVVVGSQFPFDRLVKTVDIWASNRSDVYITGQIGKNSYRPKHMKYFETMNAKDFNTCFSESDLIISHAGMGVILKSLMENKPMIVLPRRLQFKEINTDHQLATVQALNKMNCINAALDAEELIKYLEKPDQILSKRKIGEFASKDLLNAIETFVNES